MKKAYRTTKNGVVSSRLYRDERDPAFELPEVTTEDAGKVATVSAEGTWGAAAPASQLPSVTASDEGKVLTVSNQGAWTKAAVPTELPAVTSDDAGKVLTVDSEGEWGADTPANPLPAVTSEDAGKVLTVSNAGAWEAAASGGGDDIKTYKIFVSSLANNAKNGIGHIGDIGASAEAYDDYMSDVLSGKQINIVLSRGFYNDGPFNAKYDGQYTGKVYGTIYDGNSILFAAEISIAGNLSTETEKMQCATFANIKKFTLEAPW